MLDEASIQKAYHRYANFYDLVFGAIFHPGRKYAIDRLDIRTGDAILEVGVGTGLSLAHYPADSRVYGIDLSESMLAHARERVESQELHHVKELKASDVQNMTYADNTFDKVVAMYVASVVEDPKKMVEEIRRVAKPGATIIFLNHFSSDNWLMKRVEKSLSPLAKQIGFNPSFSLPHFIQSTGFQPTAVLPANLFGYWSLVEGKNTAPHKA